MSVRSIRLWRRCVQISVALAFIAIPILHSYGFHAISGNFLAFNLAGLPFADPLSTLQAALGSWSFTRDMLVGAGLSLLLAATLGVVFCSWICPFGLISELVHKTPALPSKKNPPLSLKRYTLKISLVLLGFFAVLVWNTGPLLNQLSMPAWYSRSMQHAGFYGLILWTPLIFMLVILIAEFFLRKRFWCMYICPQSVLISLANILLPKSLGVQFNPKRCTCTANKQICLQACSLELNPRKPNTIQYLQCTNCGDCIDACNKQGCALSFKLVAKRT